MITFITKRIEKGHAYDVGGTVYDDIATFPAYGRLSRNSPDKLLAGARGEVDPKKRHPGEFTLWKAAGEHRLQVWPSPWGPGFPGGVANSSRPVRTVGVGGSVASVSS